MLTRLSRPFTSICCLLFVCLCLAGCAAPPDAADATAPAPIDIDSVLAKAVANGVVPGIVAVAASSDGVLYEGAFGKSDIANDAAMTIDAIFRIASMTKAVTSVAVMQLVEQGRVGLEEEAGMYLEELRSVQVLEGFTDDGEPRMRLPSTPVTVRHLLTHTSGFGYELWSPEIVRYMEVTGLPSLGADSDGFLAAPLLFDPGERWKYSIGTDWLGVLVERVSGDTLEAYFRNHILGPLGMADTHFALPDEKEPRLVTIHARQADGTLLEAPRDAPPAPAFLSGGGGLLSTAHDYLRFVRMLLGGGELDGVRILDSATVDQMAQNHIGELEAGKALTISPALTNDFDMFPASVDRFGLGFLINSDPVTSGRSAGSLAWAGIYNSYYWIDRASGATGVLMTQILPFYDPGVLGVFDEFERAVYSNLGGGE